MTRHTDTKEVFSQNWRKYDNGYKTERVLTGMTK